MNTLDAMKQALEALETLVEMTGTDIYRDAKKALRQAIAETEKQEREWVGLTDEEADEIQRSASYTAKGLLKALEAKLKEKNT